MNPDKLADLNPAKLIAGLVILLGMMAFGFAMSKATGPSEEELARARAQAEQMQSMQAAHEAMRQTLDHRAHIDAAQLQAAMQQAYTQY